jgi:hypothetical protein
VTSTDQQDRQDRQARQVRLARREFVRAHHPDTGGDPEVFWRGLQAFDRPGPGTSGVRVVAVRSHQPLLAGVLLVWRRYRRHNIAPRVH